MIYEAFDSWTDDHKFQWGWPPIIRIEQPNTSITNPTSVSSVDSSNEKEQSNTQESSMKEETFNYLSTNRVWHKDSLAQYDLTKNLFEDINSFNLKNLIELEKSELIEIEQIRQIVNASKESIKKNIHLTGQYNSETDPEITIDKFIKRITTVKTVSSQNTSSSDKITGKPNNKNEKPQTENKQSGNRRGGIK